MLPSVPSRNAEHVQGFRSDAWAGCIPSAGIRYIAHPMWDAERAEAAFALPDSACMQALPLVRFTTELLDSGRKSHASSATPHKSS